MYSRNRWPETIGVFAVGIAVGTALGILLAPRSGEETRDYLAAKADEAREYARLAKQAVQQQCLLRV